MKAIETTYIGPTNHKGAKVRATDGDNRATVDWDYNLEPDENHRRAALALADKLAWFGSWQGGHTKRGMIWCFRDDGPGVVFSRAPSKTQH